MDGFKITVERAELAATWDWQQRSSQSVWVGSSKTLHQVERKIYGVIWGSNILLTSEIGELDLCRCLDAGLNHQESCNSHTVATAEPTNCRTVLLYLRTTIA